MKVGDRIRVRIVYSTKSWVLCFTSESENEEIVEAKILKFNPDEKETLVKILEGEMVGRTTWIKNKNIMTEKE